MYHNILHQVSSISCFTSEQYFPFKNNSQPGTFHVKYQRFCSSCKTNLIMSLSLLLHSKEMNSADSSADVKLVVSYTANVASFAAVEDSVRQNYAYMICRNTQSDKPVYHVSCEY